MVIRSVVASFLPPSVVAVLAQATPGGGGGDDPIGLITNLGVAGLVGIVAYMWQRDTAKQRDKAMETLTSYQPILSNVDHALTESSRANAASAAALERTADVVQGLPTAEQMVKWQLVMERIVAEFDAPPRRRSPRE